MTHDLLRLLYISEAVGEINEMELQAIRDVGLRHNSPAGVFGVLLYRSGVFLQLLEGPAVKVEDTLRRISGDPRHTNLRVIARVPCRERRYLDYNMGVITASSAPSKQDAMDRIIAHVNCAAESGDDADVLEIVNEIVLHFAGLSGVA